ncbi:MAG: GatB/YqeY domain-containing protein [Nitrospiria bacterium]
MGLQEQFAEEMKAGMRSGDSDRVSVIRLLRATLKNKEIEKGKGLALTEDEVLKVVSTAVKRCREAIEMFSKGGREDLVQKENKELSILQSFLPKPLSEEELRAKVEEAIASSGANGMSQMGLVMKAVMPGLLGQAEGKVVRKMVQTCLEQKMV